MFARVLALVGLVTCCFALSACGGGSGGPTPPDICACPVIISTATPNPMTMAGGSVVDDANGLPLAGVKVAIEPWVAGATPLPAPQATTASDGTFAIGPVANGHYLLIVGNDVPGDATRTTVHDNVMLVGGAQTLRAPTLPPVPTIAFPTWETNGDYRLSTPDATTDVPCIADFNQQRTTRSLPQVVVDEWLSENVRAINTYAQSPQFVPGGNWPNNAFGFLTTGNAGIVGGTSCQQLIDNALGLASAYSTNAEMRWFAGQYIAYNPPATVSAAGLAEFPIDPRAFMDPNLPFWP